MREQTGGQQNAKHTPVPKQQVCARIYTSNLHNAMSSRATQTLPSNNNEKVLPYSLTKSVCANNLAGKTCKVKLNQTNSTIKFNNKCVRE